MNPPVIEPATAAEAPGAPAQKSGRWRYFGWARLPAPRKHVAARAKPNLTVSLRKWHRRAGLFAFLFMGWLGVSGIFLNQSVSLGLDARRVSWNWLNVLYGLHADVPGSGWNAGGHWLAASAQLTMFDRKTLSPAVSAPLGMVAGGGDNPLLFVATAGSLVLLDSGGARIDELTPPALPMASITRIGVLDSAPAQVVIDGTGRFASVDGERWRALSADAPVHWAQAQELPPALREAAEDLSQPSIAVEQLLIDAHSGRLFGRFGSWFVNLVGAAALLLAISGVWMMWRTRRR